MLHVLIAIALILSSSRALAIFDAQITGGQKTSKVTIDGEKQDEPLKGTVVGLAAHYHPLSMVPMGIGLFMDVGTIKGKDSGVTAELKQQTGGIEVNVWAPLPILKPYLKFNYNLFGTGEYKVSVDNSVPVFGGSSFASKDAKISGYNLAAGLEWSIVPTFGLLLQYSMNNEELKYKKLTVKNADGTSTTAEVEEEKLKFEGSTISLGFSFRL
jgi:hypothetical protein